jgi:hypothetical protein
MAFARKTLVRGWILTINFINPKSRNDAVIKYDVFFNIVAGETLKLFVNNLLFKVRFIEDEITFAVITANSKFRKE